ncbi:site-specific integrase [Parapedobacter soli]|uniref:site-specific integrase n=1 Tax=Parapedobacter soli TaxID=416955 RepID=UPI0021C89320|nr:site-specific integrase [Parapedobacter soli]
MANKIVNGNFPVNINFNLRATKPANKDMPVNAVVRFNNQRIVISNITKAQPRYWKDGKPTQHVGNVNAADIKIALKKADTAILERYNAYIEKHRAFPVDLKAFQEELRRAVFNIPEETEGPDLNDKSLINYTTTFRDEIKKGKRLLQSGKNKGMPYSAETHKSYGNLEFKLKEYRQHIGSDDVLFDDIGMDFYYRFKDMVESQDHTPGYFGTLVKCLKTIMESARHEGYHNNTGYKDRKFIKPQPETENTIYLNSAQLDTLAGLDLSDKPHLDRSRDLFLIGAYTGLRFSDYSTVEPKHIDGDFIRIKTQKTGERVAIPIMDNLRAVLDKNGGRAPESISIQKLNEHLKTLGELAGFTQEVDFVDYVKGKRVLKKVAFYSLIGTHTARRSFATNMFELGIPTLLIMAITGHRTEKAFLTYIRKNNEDKAQMMLRLLRDRQAEQERAKLKVVGGGE